MRGILFVRVGGGWVTLKEYIEFYILKKSVYKNRYN